MCIKYVIYIKVNLKIIISNNNIKTNYYYK